MSFIIKENAKPKVPPVEPGVYVGICVGVINIGEQFSEKFKNYANKVKLIFELAGEIVEIDGQQKPRQLSKEFTFAIGKKSGLLKFLQSWDGRVYTDEQIGAMDLSKRLGLCCQLQVVLNETGEYANIDNVMALPKGFPAPKPLSEMILFDVNEWDDAVFEKLSEWTQEQCKKSTQFQKNHASTEEIKADPETGEVVGSPAGGWPQAASSAPTEGSVPF